MEFVPYTEAEKRKINERVRERIRQKKLLRIGYIQRPIKSPSISEIKERVKQTVRRLEEDSEGEDLENVNRSASSSPLASDYDLFKSIGFSSKSNSKKPKLDLEQSDILKDSTNTFVKDCTRVLFSSSESSNSSVCSEREIDFKDAEPEAPLTSGSGDGPNESYTDSTREHSVSQDTSTELSEEINILTKEERSRFKKLGNIEKLDIQMDMSEVKDPSGPSKAKVYCIKEEAKLYTYPGVLMTPLRDNRITYLIIAGKTCRPMERKLEANLFFTVNEGSIVLKSQAHRVFDVASNKLALSSAKVHVGQSFFIPAGHIYAIINENEFEAKLVVFRETISV